MKRQHIVLLIMVSVAITLTVVSTRFVYPVGCRTMRCPDATLTAGFPLPVYKDITGSSPTSGWGTLGPEEFMLEFFLLNVGLYTGFFWLIWWMVRAAVQRVHHAGRDAPA